MKSFKTFIKIIILALTFEVGFLLSNAINKPKEVIIYIYQNGKCIATDLKHKKTVIDYDLNHLVKYCSENNYKIIDIIEKDSKI